MLNIEFCFFIKSLSFRSFKIEINDKDIIKLTNRFLSTSFSTTGALISVQHLQHEENVSVKLNPIHYGTSMQTDHNSGAYLFLPDGEAKEIPAGSHDLVRVQRGPIVSRVDVLHEMYGLQYRLTNTNSLYHMIVFINEKIRFLYYV